MVVFWGGFEELQRAAPALRSGVKGVGLALVDDTAMCLCDVGAQPVVQSAAGAHIGNRQRQPVSSCDQPRTADQFIIEKPFVSLAAVGNGPE